MDPTLLTSAGVAGMSAGLAALGLVPEAMVAGLAGCIVVQTLTPSRRPRTFFSLFTITVGSVLLASLATPILFALLMRQFNEALEGIPKDAIRSATAAAVGAFAQPILLRIRRFVEKWFDTHINSRYPERFSPPTVPRAQPMPPVTPRRPKPKTAQPAEDEES